jgi:hypothetical protein
MNEMENITKKQNDLLELQRKSIDQLKISLKSSKDESKKWQGRVSVLSHKIEEANRNAEKWKLRTLELERDAENKKRTYAQKRVRKIPTVDRSIPIGMLAKSANFNYKRMESDDSSEDSSDDMEISKITKLAETQSVKQTTPTLALSPRKNHQNQIADQQQFTFNPQEYSPSSSSENQFNLERVRGEITSMKFIDEETQQAILETIENVKRNKLSKKIGKKSTGVGIIRNPSQQNEEENLNGNSLKNSTPNTVGNRNNDINRVKKNSTTGKVTHEIDASNSLKSGTNNQNTQKNQQKDADSTIRSGKNAGTNPAEKNQQLGNSQPSYAAIATRNMPDPETIKRREEAQKLKRLAANRLKAAAKMIAPRTAPLEFARFYFKLNDPRAFRYCTSVKESVKLLWAIPKALGIKREKIFEVSRIGYAFVEVYTTTEDLAAVMATFEKAGVPTHTNRNLLEPPQYNPDLDVRSKVINRLGWLFRRAKLQNLKKCILSGLPADVQNEIAEFAKDPVQYKIKSRQANTLIPAPTTAITTTTEKDWELSVRQRYDIAQSNNELTAMDTNTADDSNTNAGLSSSQ